MVLGRPAPTGYAGGSKSDLKNSLMLLRDLGPAVVISSASIGAVPFKELGSDDIRTVKVSFADAPVILHEEKTHGL